MHLTAMKPTTLKLITIKLRIARSVAALAVGTLLTAACAAKPVPLPDHWVGTWGTANVSFSPPKGYTGYLPGAADTTLRQIVHTSLGGALVRVEFTNAFGTEPLTIGAVHVALAAPGGNMSGDTALMTANALTFNGAASITIPPGGEAISDPAGLTLPEGADVVVSMFLPTQTINVATRHDGAFQTNFVAAGNVVGERSISGTTPAPQKIGSWYFLKAVDVQAPGASAAVVAFGDSITDGAASTANTNRRWPDLLAKRLAGDKLTRNLAVINEGIGGNRVLNDMPESWKDRGYNFGQSALARFDRDVLSLAGVRYMIVLESINDIGNAFNPKDPVDPVTADSVIAGLAQLVERAHTHGITVFGATLTPYGGAGYQSAAGEQVRQAVNAWIRTTKLFDGVIDFDKATSDGGDPERFKPAFDSGDHLHPDDAGMKAMADAVDLKMFAPKK